MSYSWVKGTCYHDVTNVIMNMSIKSYLNVTHIIIDNDHIVSLHIDTHIHD